MDIQILQLIEGAKQAKGLTVIIDVFRAFSLTCYMADQGAKPIIPVGDIEVAYALKKQFPEALLVGERMELVPEGFDFGNSPTHLLNHDLTGKRIIHTTSSGTQGLVNAKGASEILTGSFVNAPAIVRYIQQKQPTNVSLVGMGYATMYPTEEDTFCAEYIRDLLLGREVNMPQIIETIRLSSGRRLFDPKNQAHSPETDFYLCLETGKFNFVLKAEPWENGLLQLRKIDC